MPYSDPEKRRTYQREYQRKWRDNNRERFNEISRNHYVRHAEKIKENANKKYRPQDRYIRHLKKTFGLTIEMFFAILEKQGNGCAICGKYREELKAKYVVDHNHQNNEIRGILCSPCNWTLGHMSDSAENLESAAKYLRKRNPEYFVFDEYPDGMEW